MLVPALRERPPEVGRTDPEERREQEGGEVAGRARGRQEVEERQDRLGLLGREEPRLLVVGVGDAVARKDPLRGLRAGVAADEDAHVAEPDAVLRQVPLVVGRRVRGIEPAKPLHLPGGVLQEDGEARRLVPVAGVSALGVGKPAGQRLQQVHRRAPREVGQIPEAPVALRIRHGTILDAPPPLGHSAEPARRFAEDRVERVRELPGGPPGLVERQRRLRAVAGLDELLRGEVGRHVRPAPAVDGLLGVPDDQQESLPRLRRIGSLDPVDPVGEDPSEDVPLPLVGVLELVHQRDAVAAADGVQQFAAHAPLLALRLPGDRPARLRHEVVEGQGRRFGLQAQEVRPGEPGQTGGHLVGEDFGGALHGRGESSEIGPDIKKMHASSLSVHGRIQLRAGGCGGRHGRDERPEIVGAQRGRVLADRLDGGLEPGPGTAVDHESVQVEVERGREARERSARRFVEAPRFFRGIAAFRPGAEPFLRLGGEGVRRVEPGRQHVGVEVPGELRPEFVAAEGREDRAVDRVVVGAGDVEPHRDAVSEGEGREQFAAEGVDGADRRLGEVGSQASGLVEDPPDPVLELARRLVREGDEQDVPHVDPAGLVRIRHELQHDALQREGLPRAGGGLDDAVAVVEERVPDGAPAVLSVGEQFLDSFPVHCASPFVAARSSRSPERGSL